MFPIRRIAALVLAAAALTACGTDSSTAPTVTPVLGASASALSSSAVKLTFNSKAGDTGYNIERAEGSAGAFGQVGTVAAPSTAGALSYTDANLKVSTAYRYRVITVRGSSTSVASAEVSVTTLAFGSAAADIAARRGGGSSSRPACRRKPPFVRLRAPARPAR